MRTDRQTDGQTDVTNLIVAFRNFANALNIDFVPGRKYSPLMMFVGTVILIRELHDIYKYTLFQNV